jgi:hypothetical protein
LIWHGFHFASGRCGCHLIEMQEKSGVTRARSDVR